MPNLIDIGANLTNSRFKSDLPNVIARAQAQGVHKMIVTGTSLQASKEALALTEQFPTRLTCTSGVHPHDASEWNPTTAAEITALAQHASVVAVGECGLDFFRDISPRDQQIHCYEAQLHIAAQVQKPVFLHQRDAHDEFLAILKQHRNPLPNAVVHCFTGTAQQAFDYLDQDCHIGITGWLCDPRRGDDLRQAVKSIPLDKLMIETDSPYLLPKDLSSNLTKPKSNRNEPAFLPHILNTLADILNHPPQLLSERLTANTCAFFAL
ncbi:MAG: hydrolase TatD [Gammaproteobacteria bacterium]|nr:hydrolase TatD [Gammaproteobacteria bacterium]